MRIPIEVTPKPLEELGNKYTIPNQEITEGTAFTAFRAHTVKSRVGTACLAVGAVALCAMTVIGAAGLIVTAAASSKFRSSVKRVYRKIAGDRLKQVYLVLVKLPEHPLQMRQPPQAGALEVPKVKMQQEKAKKPHQELLKALKPYISKDQKLPRAGGPLKMTGVEHIIAILYWKLVEEAERTDCTIVLNAAGEGVLPEDFNGQGMSNYVIIPLSVQENSHNTVLIIDHQAKQYAYFDSLQGSFSEEAKNECIEKKAMAEDYTQVYTGETSSCQIDGWSCGYHVVKNTLAFLEDPKNKESEERNRYPNGEVLHNEYAEAFSAFAASHGREEAEVDKELLYRQQKLCLWTAVEKAKVNNRSLETLYNALDADVQDGDSLKRPLTEFIDQYVVDFPEDHTGCKVLSEALNPRSIVNRNLPKHIENTQEEANRQENNIADFLLSSVCNA